MHVQYNDTTNQIEISDHIWSTFFYIPLILITNSVRILTDFKEQPALDIFEWIIVTLLCLTLYLLFFKLSLKSKIHLNEIECLELKKAFGTLRFAIKLKNGRRRNINHHYRDHFFEDDLKEMFISLHIPIERVSLWKFW